MTDEQRGNAATVAMSARVAPLVDKMTDDATHGAFNAMGELTAHLSDDEQGDLRDRISDAMADIIGDMIAYHPAARDLASLES